MSDWREILPQAESWIRRHYYPIRDHIITSGGTANKFQPVITGSDGLLDDSLLPDDATFGSVSVDGDIVVKNGATTVTTLKNDNNVGTAADILFSASGSLAAEGDLNFLIDSNNDSANAAFKIAKDSEGTTGSTQLFQVNESGGVKVGTGTPITSLDVAGESVWIRSGLTGALASGAGKGLRLGYASGTDQGSLFAYDYATSTAKDLVLQGAGGNLGVGVSPTTKLHIEGDLRVQGVEGGNATIYLYADQGDDAADKWYLRADTSGNFVLQSENSGTMINIVPGVTGKFRAQYMFANTTIDAANMRVIDVAGEVARSTSSIKYKKDVMALPDKWGWPFIKQLRPAAFRSLCAADDPERWHVGLVAEEVAAIGGLEESPYVSYVDGEVEGVQYERLVVPAILALQQQAEVIQDLRRRIAALEQARG